MVMTKEEKREYDKKYRAKNKEKIRERKREYHDTNKEQIKEKSKEYRAKNKDKIREHQKEYYEKNKEEIIERRKEYIKQYQQTPEGIKSNTLSNWRYCGVIGDLPTIYEERYLPSTACEVCKKTYSSSSDRCLDHDHSTGEFRQMLCRSCNSMDNWKKIAETETKI